MPYAVRIAQSVQKALHSVPSVERQALWRELVGLARRAGETLPVGVALRPVGLQVALAGYRLRLELDCAAGSLRLVGLTRRAVAPTRLAA